MSDFVSEGFRPFPNTYADEKGTLGISEWTDEHLDYKTNEYGQFLQRKDIMARAREVGDIILDRLLFEMAYRDGLYEINVNKLEDSICE